MTDNSPKILAVIPARGGSKGVPRKNIRVINGKPLIAYTIETALAVKDLYIASSSVQMISRLPRLPDGTVQKCLSCDQLIWAEIGFPWCLSYNMP